MGAAEGAASEGHPRARIESPRPCRAQRARVGEGVSAVGEVRQSAGVEELSVGRVPVVEDVVDLAVELDVLGDLVGGVQVEDGIGRQLRILVGFIADKILAGDEQRIAADLPLIGHGIVDTDLDAVARDRGDLVAGRDLDVAGGIREGAVRAERQWVEEAGIDEGVARLELKRLRKSVIYFAGINLVIGFSINFGANLTGVLVDNSAHIGGFLCGLLFASPMVPRIGSPRSSFKLRLQWAVIMIVLILVLFGFYMAQLPPRS